VDFHDVEHIDTSVLAILIETLKVSCVLGKTFQLCRLNGRPRYLFEATRLLHFFGTVQEHVPPAANSVGSPR
jgi:anti-anti-sigma regulatory factor